jgi:uncharacterized integral membrane protein
VPRLRGLSEEQIREWQPRFWARLLGLIAIAVFVIAFILENRKHVHVHFVLFTARVSQIWLILLAFAIGVFAGALLAQLQRRRSGRH